MFLSAPLIHLLRAIFTLFLPNHDAGGGRSSLSSQSEQGKEEAGRQSTFESQSGHCLAECSWVSYSTSLSSSFMPKRYSNANSTIDALPMSPSNPIRIFEHTPVCTYSQWQTPMAQASRTLLGTHNPWEFILHQAPRVSHIQIPVVLFPDGDCSMCEFSCFQNPSVG